jgi:hypothetical protein
MVAVKKKLIDEMGTAGNIFEKDTLLTIGESIFDVVGKIGLAVGTTGILFYLFGIVEAILALNTLYTGIAIIASGLLSASVSNKLRTGNWIKGLLA